MVLRRVWCACLFLLAIQDPASLPACGPFFPNNLLGGGDDAVLVAPVTDFVGELRRMKLVETRFQAVPVKDPQESGGFAKQSATAELADLAAALSQARVPDDERERIRFAHEAARARFNQFFTDSAARESSRPWVFDEEGARRGQPQSPPPLFPNVEVPAGLPGEFADYFEGALAWHNPAANGKARARAAWKRLLARPPQERHYKSTWAAFMLGKACETEEPDRAVQYFQQVRDLARHGFADSVGLAAASLGLEARICLKQKQYDRAIERYLEQLATDDPTAGPSLVWTSAEAIRQGPEVLRRLAKNPRAQRVITAFVISRRYQRWFEMEAEAASEGSRPGLNADASRAWLEAVEAAGVKDLESAAKLALAAYQNNDMALAWRWIQRAPNSPVARWLHAKLLLRSGKTAAAAELLAGVAHTFPIEPSNTNRLASARFQDLLSVEAASYCYPELIPAEQQVLGELGVLRLARREYAQALDALLNAGFWMDAAYVAERVLTIDELKEYVDSYWPPVSPEQAAEENENSSDCHLSPALLRTQIRYLLARRLMRSQRGTEAQAYYPPEWTPQYLCLARALRMAWDESLPANQRATAFFQAAMITRTNGMELIGTEVQPDWHIYGGDYEEGVTAAARATNAAARALVVGKDELDRAARHGVDPELRFHYRYQAASLAWEAAKLMPDNSDETARVLCTAGSWLKYRDPRAADVFYKALVQRNRKTPIGAEANRIRWFPQLDNQGKLVPRKPSEPNPSNPPPEQSAEQPPQAEPEAVASDYPVPGKVYVIQAGDSASGIARAASIFGKSISEEELLKTNPGLDPNLLRIGQRILIPAGKPAGDTSPGQEP